MTMQEESILQALESLLHQLSIDLRYEKGDFEGGLCRIKNQKMLIIDEGLPITKKIKIIASELSSLDLEGVYVLPVVRKVIEEGKCSVK